MRRDQELFNAGASPLQTDTPLIHLLRSYVEKDPLAAAHSLEAMPDEEAVHALGTLPASLCVKLIPHLQIGRAAVLLQKLTPEQFKAIGERLEPRLVATILLDMPKEIKKAFLDPLSNDVKGQLRELLTYPENSAGRILSTDFLKFSIETRVRDAMAKIRTLGRSGVPPSYAFVLDDSDRLAGVLNMRDLIVASGDSTLGSIMRTEVFSVSAFTDREEVANELSQRHFFAVPVVDSQARLLGIIRTEELLEDVQEEATEDLQKMVGAGGDERPFSPVPFSLFRRLPWLGINLLTAFLAASVVALFEDVIAKITVLAVFLPVVAGQGGNAGAQSLAVVMRGIVMREIPRERRRSLILKESGIGLANGVIIGIVAGFFVWVWQGNPYLGLVIALAMVVNLLVAGLFGAAIPLTMKAMGRDPAQSSNIILTTVTDVVGFFVFLGFGVIFSRYLI